MINAIHTDTHATVALMFDPNTIRARSAQIHELVSLGRSAHWRLDEDALDQCINFVFAHIQENYPDFDIPYHGRLRHFGDTLMATLETKLANHTSMERARAYFDLIVISVLLDAGAGEAWRFTHPQTGVATGRSEGLAIASMHMFFDGLFSSKGADDPCRVDASTLCTLSDEALKNGLQISDTNPMIGLSARATLLRRLGAVMQETPNLFSHTTSKDTRPGHLVDVLDAKKSPQHTLEGKDVLEVILHGLGPIWPGRIHRSGVNLGDVFVHPAVRGVHQEDNHLISFHKLSQWLTYSLLEPLEQLGFKIVGLDQLTGLAEYRNGGLFVDMGVLIPVEDDALLLAHETSSEFVIEWRAMTVHLLDRVHAAIKQRQHWSDQEFPLVKLLQGGTWSAGRVTARERRADGSPPVKIIRDGTVF